MMKRVAIGAGLGLWLAAAGWTGASAVPCSEERDNVADLVEFCKEVSPATHPPCNAANECSLIEGEISRGCALLSPAERPAQCKGF